MEVELLKKRLIPRSSRKSESDGNVGDVVDLPHNIACRWVNRGIASYRSVTSHDYLEKLNYYGSGKLYDHHSLKNYVKHDRVSIVIPVCGALSYLVKCFNSLTKFTQNYELIIIDNGSDNKTKAYLNDKWVQFGFKLIENEENKGFSYACNQGIKASTCNYVCFLNSDTVLTPNWLGKLMKGFNQQNAGIVGPSTCYTAGEQCLGHLMENRFKMDDNEIIAMSLSLWEEYKETEIYGWCYLVKREVIDKIGGFDYKTFGIGNGEENDFNYRAELAGYKMYWVKSSYVHHYGHKSFEDTGINLNRLLKNNYKKLNDIKKSGRTYVKNDVTYKIKKYQLPATPKI